MRVVDKQEATESDRFWVHAGKISVNAEVLFPASLKPTVSVLETLARSPCDLIKNQER
jgi:hypothetical protein